MTWKHLWIWLTKRCDKCNKRFRLGELVHIIDVSNYWTVVTAPSYMYYHIDCRPMPPTDLDVLRVPKVHRVPRDLELSNNLRRVGIEPPVIRDGHDFVKDVIHPPSNPQNYWPPKDDQ